ncbi:CBN-GEI-17 protein [Caenorhabditis brenneri]|uniref:CBN-GEI-17 protein n=1 Tax=Caenorhabditis brenneri TaxID=135651 RepID=G0NXP1_CAEBE|nr:CBN-GEI-17 protein [Caenorhabditis brenneri]
MIGAGGALHPFPINNGLSNEENQTACTAIYKLKVAELQTVAIHCGIQKNRGQKKDQQKFLIESLYNPRLSREILEMAVRCCSTSTEAIQMQQRGRGPASQNRHQPYPSQARNGPNMMNNPFPQNHHQQHPMNSMALQQSFQHSMTMGKLYADPFEIVPLPFYDVVSTLLNPVELHAAAGSNKQSKQLNFQFQLGLDHINKVAYRPETPLPRYEIQLRFFNITEKGQPQKDDFPLNCHTRVDESIVQLPNIIPTNKPNAEPKRPSRPVNITQHLSRFKQRDHTLSVEWLADKRVWAAAIYFVYRVDSDHLFKRLDDNPQKHRSLEATKQEIIKKLNGGEDDIAMDQLKISLLDPLSKMRMKTPVRCQDCTHLQCFDLMSYLMMNEKKPTWQCPVCSANCPYNRLIVDNYFLDMLSKVDKNMTEVELKKDGSYDVIKEEADICLSDDDDDDYDIKPSTNGTASTSNSNAENGGKKRKAPIPDDDIITLSDTDDEDLNRDSVGSLKTPPQKKKGKGNDIEVITLDDTPPSQSHPSTVPMRQLSQNNNIPSSSSPGLGSSQSLSNHGTLGAGALGSHRSSHSTQPSPIMQQQIPPHQMGYQHIAYMNGQPPGSQNGQSQFSYGFMTQGYPMQNGIIGRNNQMVHMPPPPHSQPSPQGMPPTFFNQQQMQNGSNITAPRLLSGPELRTAQFGSSSIRFVDNPPPGVTMRNPRRPNQ